MDSVFFTFQSCQKHFLMKDWTTSCLILQSWIPGASQPCRVMFSNTPASSSSLPPPGLRHTATQQHYPPPPPPLWEPQPASSTPIPGHLQGGQRSACHQHPQPRPPASFPSPFFPPSPSSSVHSSSQVLFPVILPPSPAVLALPTQCSIAASGEPSSQMPPPSYPPPQHHLHQPSGQQLPSLFPPACQAQTLPYSQYRSQAQTQTLCQGQPGTPEQNGILDWLRRLRLHKYYPVFKQLTMEEFLGLTEEDLNKYDLTQGAKKKLKTQLELQKSFDREMKLEKLSCSSVARVTPSTHMGSSTYHTSSAGELQVDVDSGPHHHPVATDGGSSGSPCSPRTLYCDSTGDRTKDVHRRLSGQDVPAGGSESDQSCQFLLSSSCPSGSARPTAQVLPVQTDSALPLSPSSSFSLTHSSYPPPGQRPPVVALSSFKPTTAHPGLLPQVLGSSAVSCGGQGEAADPRSMWGWARLQWGGQWRGGGWDEAGELTLQARHGQIFGPPGLPALSGLGWCCCWSDGGDQLCHDLHLKQPPPRVPPSPALPPVFLFLPVSFCVLLLPSHLYLLTSSELRKCWCSRGSGVRKLVPPPPPHLQHHPFIRSLIASGSRSDLSGLCMCLLWVSGQLWPIWSVAWIRNVRLLTATISRPLPLQSGPSAPPEPRRSHIQHRRHVPLLPHNGAVVHVPPQPRVTRAAPGLCLLPTPQPGWNRESETGRGGPVVLQLWFRRTQSGGVQAARHGASTARDVSTQVPSSLRQ
uniref:SAM domain-containing protein n=1 Tax=Takifugu rubripes TaxID=31033 RepID=A0A674MCI6_TAKRU